MLFSAKHQHESAIGGISYLPSLLKLPPTSFPIPAPYVVTELPSLSSLSPTAHFHWLSILHMIVLMLFHPYIQPSPSSPPRVHKSILYVCASIAAPKIYISKTLFKYDFLCYSFTDSQI